jgi:hypothetical protein
MDITSGIFLIIIIFSAITHEVMRGLLNGSWMLELAHYI